MNIPVYHEAKRGCGYRQPGGLYLRDDNPTTSCCKLPLKVERCPTCDHGIKPSRSWTWIDGDEWFKGPCQIRNPFCRLARLGIGRIGLLWIGEKFYPTPNDFTFEAEVMGLSRRIPAVPREFEVGKTWVALAHRKTFSSKCKRCDGKAQVIDPHTEAMTDCPECERGIVYTPGIFRLCLPTRVEYVVKGDETEEELEKLVKRGLTPVKVIPKPSPDQPLGLDGDPEPYDSPWDGTEEEQADAR